ncbi:sensor domain-containing protein [Gordonia amicalis]|uniref:sensor domain-containing protein n=1 Tax=Gordonia amicalis TaxID=89053 RepID=UPI002952D4B7|nr:sensor domain-containing protein [Gordonia amicalis]MDV7102055.1 sensor domain-containing protein [Gordonia amicalis]
MSSLASSPSPSASAPVQAVRAKDLLLTKAELLDGFWDESDDTSPDAEADQQSDAPQCLRQSEALRTPALTESAAAGWTWSNTETVDAIYSLSYVYGSEAAAVNAFDAYRTRADGCTSWTAAAFAEKQVLFPMSVGDQSFGRMTTTTSVSHPEFSGGNQYWGVVRVKNVIVEAAYYPGPLLDTTNGQARTTRLVSKSAEKAE